MISIESTYKNYIKSTPVLIMLVGLPGSGKSTYAKQFEDAFKIHSSDAIRKRLYDNEIVQEDPNRIFTILHNEIKNDLKNNISCIYDATNINYKRRKAFLEELKNIPCIKTCVVIATPYECVLQNNNKRERKVPMNVINKMYKHFDVPYYYEGWDNIKLYYAEDSFKIFYGTPQKAIEYNLTFNQHNKNHMLSLGEHCRKCAEYVNKNNTSLMYAAMLHDLGKPFCMSYLDSKGNLRIDAHYYNHQYVSSYNSLFYNIEEKINRLYTAVLIRWHMQPYFIHKDKKLVNKYTKLLGNELWKDIMELHQSDVLAH